ncbi:glutathione peroxidase [Lacticaseibacillus mingshuiensis]|uniref:Glutathione peroxidase n=1 Tax=Lacticaseibacillus mingshuiensis TaxID=2799574 RepID=A0ABW4CHK4_9LACO|nr:glutathione peroxidase [Lacticaseibacillus mingshuiensis]
MSIYDEQVTLEDGTDYTLAKYAGHPLLIVNTATKCGFSPQFAGLEALYQEYKDQGLVVLGFPSDQFHQELADGQAAAEACRTTYGVTFPMHSLVSVNGDDALPLFDALKDAAPGALGKAIKWNFTKFLVDQNGNVVKRYAPKTTPDKIAPDIAKLLAN